MGPVVQFPETCYLKEGHVPCVAEVGPRGAFLLPGNSISGLRDSNSLTVKTNLLLTARHGRPDGYSCLAVHFRLELERKGQYCFRRAPASLGQGINKVSHVSD